MPSTRSKSSNTGVSTQPAQPKPTATRRTSQQVADEKEAKKREKAEKKRATKAALACLAVLEARELEQTEKRRNQPGISLGSNKNGNVETDSLREHGTVSNFIISSLLSMHTDQ